MKIKLSKNWIKYLQGEPETGMGYQRVKITFTDGTSTLSTVFNCEKLSIHPKHEKKTISLITVIE